VNGHGEPPRILSRDPLHHVPAAGLVLEIDIGEVLAVGARNLKAFSVLDQLERLAEGAVRARQLCAVEANGLTSFAAMQAATDHRSSDELVYFVFDLLHLDREDMSCLPLLERKAKLEKLLARAPAGLRYSQHFAEPGPQVLAAACRIGAEGIVSKRSDQPYAPGNRGVWVKTKCLNRQEFVVVGWVEGEGSRKDFGALLLAHYRDGKLVYAGRVGTGMTSREMADLRRRLEPLTIERMPLSVPPPRDSRFGRPLELGKVHWVRPELAVEVTFLTWTDDGLLRQVAYQGLRQVRNPREVTLERTPK
jgi:bifunctional non-homologous end joining protein LigD